MFYEFTNVSGCIYVRINEQTLLNQQACVRLISFLFLCFQVSVKSAETGRYTTLTIHKVDSLDTSGKFARAELLHLTMLRQQDRFSLL